MKNKKINVTVKKRGQNLLNSFKPIIMILLLGGYNYGYYIKIRLLMLAVRCYTVILLLSVSANEFIFHLPSNLINMFTLFEFVSSVIIVNFTYKSTRLFFSRLHEISAILRLNARAGDVACRVLLLLSCVFVVIRVSFEIFPKIREKQYKIGLYTCHVILHCHWKVMNDIYRFWRCALIEMIRSRLVGVRIQLEEISSNDYLGVRRNQILINNKIRLMLDLYKKIADTYDLFSYELHASMFVSISCALPKIIYFTYKLILAIESKDIQAYTTFSERLLQLTIVTYCPYLFMELCCVEVDKIKTFLIKRSLRESDPVMKKSLCLFVDYIQRRNYEKKIWRMIPLNIALPFELTHLCSTYVIVWLNYAS